MKHFFSIFCLLALLASCGTGQGERFEACGTIDGAEGKTLYLDIVGLNGIEAIDSVKLKADGTFSLHGLRPAAPELYRLRLGDEIINFCIDSTETVTFTAKAGDMGAGYKVEGSEHCEEMRELALMQLQLRRDAEEIMTRDGMAPSQRQAALQARVDAYKRGVAERYVVTDPGSMVAYYALFQSFGGAMIFDPEYSKDDVRCFGAVATAWDALYPESPRAAHLHDMALRGMANTRLPQQNTLPIDMDKIEETGIIDMTLCDPDGREIALSSLKGKVVMLDFAATTAPDYGQRVIAMRELYGKYAERGFEIYQVSVDEDIHLWKTRAANVPWTCVHIADKSDLLLLYQVQAVPTYFLIDRGSNLVCRDSEVEDIDAMLTKLL